MQVIIHRHRSLDAIRGQLEAAGKAYSPLYDDLHRRMAGALAELLGKTRDDKAWREDLHPRANNGQFGHGNVPVHADQGEERPAKPTTTTAKGGMDKIRELLHSGHSFSKAELLTATGLREKALGDYLAMLKNPKWAGKAGALKIEKDAQGNFFVAKADGTPAPKAPPLEAPEPPAAPPKVSPFAKQQLNLQERFDRQLETIKETQKQHPDILDTPNGELVKRHRAYAFERLREGIHHQDDVDFVERHINIAAHSMASAVTAKREAEQRAKELADAKAAAGVAEVRKPFTPQKTAKAASEYAVKNNMTDAANFKGMHIDAVNAQLESLSDHLDEFPELRTRMGFAGEMSGFKKASLEHNQEQARKRWAERAATDPEMVERWLASVKSSIKPSRNAWAASWGGRRETMTSGVACNGKYMKDSEFPKFAESMKRDVTDGFHPPGCDTVKSIMDHEYGHQIDHLLGRISGTPAFQAIINEAAGGAAAHTARTPLSQTGQVIGPLVKDNIAAAVSRYATTNNAEFLAEAWSESKNNPNPRPTAVKVAALIRSAYAQKFGKAA